MKDVTPAKFACVAMVSCPAIIEVTPQDMRCGSGGCPAVFDVTPAAMACGDVLTCPAIYEQQDGHIVVGKIIETLPPELVGRVGADEIAVWVPKGMVKPGDA